MFKERPVILLLFCAVLLVSTAVLQYLLPQFGFLDGGLVVVILLTVFLKERRYTLWFGLFSMLLVIFSAFYPNEGQSLLQIGLQHLFSVILLLLSTLTVVYVKNLYSSIEEDQSRMNALFEHATEGIILKIGRAHV